MAASMKMWSARGFVIVRSANCVLTKNVLSNEATISPRALVNYETSRGRKRSTVPPSWFVRRNPKIVNEDLTTENQEFLSELVHDTYSKQESPLKDGPWERGTWTHRTFRTGVLAVKIGVLPQWTTDGHKYYTTLLQILDNHVIRYTSPEKLRTSMGWKPNWGTKYGAVVVGALSSDPHEFSREYVNLFAEAGLPPKRKLTRFIVTPNAAIQPGTPLNATHFRVGDFVDVQAKTIDYGFQGVVKRWGMKGMPKSHGTTKSHRRMGSAAGGGAGGIIKGKKMPGHMGADWRHLRGLLICRINYRHNVLYVKGPCLPGPPHCYVRIMDTVLPQKKCELEKGPPMPTCLPEDVTDPLPEEIFYKNLFQFTEPSIIFQEDKKK